MKIVCLLFASLGLAMAFQASPSPVRSVTSLQMGLFDGLFEKPQAPKAVAKVAPEKTTKKKKSSDNWLKNMFKEPLHGHGSAENDLDEMYQAQQQMLQERRHLFGDAGHQTMRNKYKNPEIDHLRDIPLHEHDPAMLNKKEDDAMYFDDNADTSGGGGFSFNPFKGKFSP